HFNILDDKHLMRVKQHMVSPDSDEEVSNEEIQKGYEIEPGRFVVLTEKELESLEPKPSREIEIREFVPPEAISPQWYERPYYLAPDGDEKAYFALAEALKNRNREGIAHWVMRNKAYGKEYLVAIFAENGILRAETMRFPDELRTPEDVGLPKKPKIPKATVAKFEKLISSRSKKQLSPRKLEDEQTERLLKLVKKKSFQRKNIVEVDTDAGDQREPGKVIDLVAMLKKSLAGKG
ncbi:MAG: hypothetical protein M3R52_09005, partial [Acidobacteriota bacterium]|nr:hypothetical protein [Acidobacteriota bacterium]